MAFLPAMPASMEMVASAAAAWPSHANAMIGSRRMYTRISVEEETVMSVSRWERNDHLLTIYNVPGDGLQRIMAMSMASMRSGAAADAKLYGVDEKDRASELKNLISRSVPVAAALRRPRKSHSIRSRVCAQHRLDVLPAPRQCARSIVHRVNMAPVH